MIRGLGSSARCLRLGSVRGARLLGSWRSVDLESSTDGAKMVFVIRHAERHDRSCADGWSEKALRPQDTPLSQRGVRFRRACMCLLCWSCRKKDTEERARVSRGRRRESQRRQDAYKECLRSRPERKKDATLKKDTHSTHALSLCAQVRQARRLGKWLYGRLPVQSPLAIFVSPFIRCVQTADAIASELEGLQRDGLHSASATRICVTQ